MSLSLFKDNVAVVTKCLFFTICAFFFGKNAFQAWLVHESGITTTTTTIEPVPAIGKVIHPKYCKNLAGTRNKFLLLNVPLVDLHLIFEISIYKLDF